MSDLHEIHRLVVAQGEAWDEFKKNDDRIDRLDKDIDKLSSDLAGQFLKLGRPNLGDGDKPALSTPTWIDTKTRQRIHVLTNSQRLADTVSSSDPTPSIGRLMRGVVLGGRADDAMELADERKALSIGEDPSGGYTVAGKLAQPTGSTCCVPIWS